MSKKSHPTNIAVLTLFTALSLVAFFEFGNVRQPIVPLSFQAFAMAAGGRSGQPAACPRGLPENNGNCVVSETINLASNETLDCQGRTLVPLSVGRAGDARPETPPTVLSNPEVAIFLNGVNRVQIRNCKIEGFDFGIYAINGKAFESAGGHSISNNRINALFVPITLLRVDDTAVEDNPDLTFTTIGGRGIVVGRDSDRNTIRNNHITGLLTGPIGAYRAPGVEVKSNPKVTKGAAIFICQIEADEPTLLNIKLKNDLYQLVTEQSVEPNALFSEGNVVEQNVIDFPQIESDGIALSVAQATKVRWNTVRRAAASIRAGIQTAETGVPTDFPGVCSGGGTRRCLAHNDCYSIGSCPTPTSISVKWLSNSNLIESNTVSGPFGAGIVMAGNNSTVVRNTVTGPGRKPDSGGIVLFGKYAVEGKTPTDVTTIINNRVSNVPVALSLTKVFGVGQPIPTAFRAKISENDFTGYSIAVRTAFLFPVTVGKFYNLGSELSINQSGNHWGIPCSNGGFDRSKVRNAEDSTINTLVVDSFPFGNSIVPSGDGTPIVRPKPCEPLPTESTSVQRSRTPASPGRR